MAFELSNLASGEYAYKDMTVVMAGRPVIGLRGLVWKVSRTTTLIFGSGSQPHTITRGNKNYDGTITVLQSELEALLEAVQQKYGPNADLTDAVLDITVAFAVSPTARIKVHQLVGVHIQEFEMGMMQDDPNMEISLPFLFLKAQYNK